MPSNSLRYAIVVVLDVGKSVSTLHDNEEKIFFTQARDCASWIIQRKIISQSVDALSLLLIGCDESDNPTFVNSSKNISVKYDFQLPSWDMLKFIMTDIKPTNNESDWLRALMISVEMLKIYEKFNNVAGKKIVIFSDFAQPASDDIDVIINKIEDLNIEVTIIGPDHLHFSTDCEEPLSKKQKLYKSQGRQEGEKIIHYLWKKLPESIGVCTFESALKQLGSFTPKSRRIAYWNCMMDIGDVNINISMIKKTDPKPPKKFNIKCIKPNDDGPSQSAYSHDAMVNSEETAPTIRDTVMHYKHESGQNHEFVDVEVKPEETIEGFRYGKTIIPFSEEDKAAMEYKAGPKSFSVLGFTRISNVPYYLLSGECSYLVVPRDKDRNAEVALSAVIQAMKKLECLAIVRKVYNENWGLSLGILYPTIEEIFCDETDDVSYREYLFFVELAFQDDLKSIDFPSLEHIAKNITQEQYDTIDNLIDGMNLMKAENIKEPPSHRYCIVIGNMDVNDIRSLLDQLILKDYGTSLQDCEFTMVGYILKVLNAKELLLNGTCKSADMILILGRKISAAMQFDDFPFRGLRGEPCEAFDLPFLHDFKEQFYHYCVIQRGLYPDKALTTSVPSYIKNFIEVPKSVEEKCASAFKKIKKQFKIKKMLDNNDASNNQWNSKKTVEQTGEFKKKQSDFKKVEHFKESVIERETEKTTRMWMRIFQKDFPTNDELDEVFLKLADASESEISESVGSFKLVISQIRAMYLDNKTNPEKYNRWMTIFKKYLDGNGEIFCRFWEAIVMEYVGLITKQENQYSKITDEEADEFLCMAINTSFTPQNEKPNLELLDELQAEQMNLDSSLF